ncbi:cytochrome P450 [Pleomassaria siparia CBS 279.74]|uniref:Cytochrome P450 n=1 Tax=Pleomassaria siparia CBS 279.74 TaxID=1314801 RepID=A0A6G1JSZ6_9PLEO|nr:cytochrome P450 [Pleomassaria siparia CBS 279.74]
MSSGLGLDVEDLLHTSILAKGGVVVLLGLVIVLLAFQSYNTNIPHISGIPSIPSQLPFVGHLHKLGGRSGNNDCTVFSQWARDIGSSVYQCVLGNQRTVVVCDWATMYELWVGQSHALIDRPHQPGFVDKLGIDLTGFPMTDQLRKCRAAGMRALAKVRRRSLYVRQNVGLMCATGELAKKSAEGKTPIDIYPHLRHIVFDLCLSLTYGARFGEVNDDFMVKFIGSINAVSAIRSSTKPFRHFVPLLRIIPESDNQTIAAEKVRRKHRDVLYNRYQERVARGETVDCIVSSLTKDSLTEEEVHGTCISLLQAAPDTVASGVYQTIAWLSSPEGHPTQERALQAILEAYDGDRTKAWNAAFRDERIPLVNSICSEALRFFTLTPYATPRRSRNDVLMPNGAIVPKGTTFIMNAQQVNHDEDHFGADAWSFRPERFLDAKAGLPHVAFGAGSRICPAVAISNRIIRALVTRLILAFDMKASKEPGRRPNNDAIKFSHVVDELVAHPNFYDCHFKARDADWLQRVVTEEQAAARR